MIRIPDKQKLFECDFPDCFRFYESIDKLAIHKYTIHNQQVGIDPNLIKNDMSMTNTQAIGAPRFPPNMVMGGIPNMINMGINMGNNNQNFLMNPGINPTMFP